MPAKISKEICQRIYDLSGEGKPTKEIHAILKPEGIKISDKSVYNILKKKTTGTSLTSIEEEGFSLNNPVNNSFDESFSDNDTHKERENTKYSFFNPITKPINTLVPTDNEEEEKEIQIPKTLISLINQGVKEGTEQVKSMLSPQKTNDDYLDELINKTKRSWKEPNKPMPINKLPNIIPFNTDGMTESEKRLRRDMIIKIRNYIDCFSDNEIIQSICGILSYLSRGFMKRILPVLQ